MVIGVTGATGKLGRLVVERLKAKVPAEQIVALARSTAKAADLGVTVRPFDYDHPETLEPSLAGVDALLLISGSEVGRRTSQHGNVAAAARAAGVGRIVYTSLLHADTSEISLAGEHLASETAVKASGLWFTILRNGWYTENRTAGVSGMLAAGALIGSAGEGRFSYASRADYAEAAVVVLTTDGHDGATYELAGDEGYTLADVAAEVSRQTWQTIPYRDLPEAEYAATLIGAGLPAPVAKAIARFDVNASHGALFDGGRQLSALIGRPTTPLFVSVADALSRLA